MNSKDDVGHPENRPVKRLIDLILNTIDNENLQQLLTDDDTWENFVAKNELFSNEAAALHDILNNLVLDAENIEDEDTEDMEDKDMLQREQEHRERFLEEFPQRKKELENCIAQLHALADKADLIHRNCTISQVVASCTGIISGAMTIAGLALAPVTAGVSLTLSVAGMGLGTASAVTSVTTSIVEYSNRSSIEAEAKRLTSSNVNQGKETTDILIDTVPKTISAGSKFIRCVNGIDNHIYAIEVAKNYPGLVARAKRVMTTGRVSARSGRQVQKAFGGTALAMSKGARLMGAATAGFFILMDVVSLVQDTKHLSEGAKTKSAEQLRQQARELEMKLEQLKEIHESLQKDPCP